MRFLESPTILDHVTVLTVEASRSKVRPTRFSTRTAAWLLLACLTGCGGNENLAYVTGKITLDGKPLPDAFVVFAPTSGGTTSYGRSDAEGNYEMVFSDVEKGAWIGENRVEISTGDVDASGDGGGAREKVPAVYNRNTSLKVDVVAGNNTHNFDLKSDAGRIVQPVE